MEFRFKNRSTDKYNTETNNSTTKFVSQNVTATGAMISGDTYAQNPLDTFSRRRGSCQLVAYLLRICYGKLRGKLV